MQKISILALAAVASLSFWAGAAGAGTSGAIYDMSGLLSQKHPFDTSAAPQAPAYTPPAPPPVRPAVRPRPTVRPSYVAPRAQKPRPSPRITAAKPSQGGENKMVSEIMVGALLHDQGPFSHNKEGGIDTNMELLFPSPDLLSGIWKPRPHFGFSWNSAGDTSQVYVGLTWDWEFLGSGFFNFSLGGAYHTGETRTTKLDKKELGCSILFRESLDLGYRISGPHSVMLHLDHISNAKLCSSNEGLESFGLRYGYRF